MVDRISFSMNIELQDIRVIYNYFFIFNIRNSFNEIKSDQILVLIYRCLRRDDLIKRSSIKLITPIFHFTTI